MMLLKIKNSLLDTHIIKSKKNNLILFSNETNTNPINSTITDFWRDRDLIINSKCYEFSLQFANREKKQSANDSSL